MQHILATSGPKKRPPSSTMQKLDLTCRITKLGNHCSRAGGFSDVYKCQYTTESGVKEVAVKAFRFHFAIPENGGKASKTAKMIRRELGIWRRLCHPNIVPFLGIVYDFEICGSISLVSKWMPNGTIEDFFTQYDNQLTLARRLQLLLDVANGLSHLHSFPMVHGDLTCTNVLIDDRFNACLTDFGLASMVGDIPEAIQYLQMTTTRPGAIRWAAPEHFSVNTNTAAQCTTKSDVYSFGNLTLLTLSGKHPWSEVPLDIAVVLRLHQGDKPSRPTSRPIEDKHWEFIDRCWSAVDERPQAVDVVSSLKIFLDLCSPTQCIPHDSIIGPLDSTSSPHAASKSSEMDCDFSGRLSGTVTPGEISASLTLPQRQGFASPLTVTSPNLRLHPLLSGDASRIDFYFYFDLASPSFTPLRSIGSGQSVVISEEVLHTPATCPSITRMRITHDDIPQWPIDLEFHYDQHTTPTTDHPITLGDVLHAVYRSLHMRTTKQDLGQLDQSKETAIARASARRRQNVSSTAQVEVYEGVKRIDYLLDKRIFDMLIRAHDVDGVYHWRLITVSKRGYYLR